MDKQSPTVRLQVHLMSVAMSKGGFTNTINNLKNASRFAREAKAEMETYFRAVRSAKDADPNWTDDDIAQQILDRIEARRKAV